MEMLPYYLLYCIDDKRYDSWSISNEKNTEAHDCHQIHFIVFFNVIYFKCNTCFPSMCKQVYTVHEELFVFHFKPVIYRMDDYSSQTNLCPRSESFRDQNTWYWDVKLQTSHQISAKSVNICKSYIKFSKVTKKHISVHYRHRRDWLSSVRPCEWQDVCTPKVCVQNVHWGYRGGSPTAVQA